MKKLVALMLIFVMTASVIGGCNGATPEATTVATEETKSATFTVTDMADRQVEIPENIESIATFGSIGVINAFVELMGCGDKICNDMSQNFTQTDKWAMQYVFAPQMEGAPVLESADGEIKMEDVISLNPDLCLVMSQDLIEPLESNGMTVVYFEWKETDDVKTAVTLMGEVLGKQDVASDYLAYFDETTKEAQSLTADLADDEKKTVLYGGVTQLTQPHVIAEWWIEAAGGISVTKDSWGEDQQCTYTQEDLLKWDPDVMIVTDKSMIEEIKADPLYSDLKAVKNDAIYAIPTVAHVWGNRTVEQPLTVFWTLNKLYPELVTDETLKEKISDFYEHYFKCQLTDDQINAIIGTK
ncbi:MAG: ABC transporter substrate-binding protein [Lachnospiraceae bacterium]|nr:ABC transporter substrate-binding protein [Lachnospiraceae bacterium]